MKMKHLCLATLFCVTGLLSAQNISNNALGLRIGNTDGFGPEISYQRYLQENNRLELGLGLKDRRDFNAYKLKGLYQWVFQLPGTFKWYTGVGASTGFLDFNPAFLDGDEITNNFFAGAEGVFGVEYSFTKKSVPIQLSLDINPRLELINDYDDNRINFGLAFGVRYLFD